jgi:hypothetical protein
MKAVRTALMLLACLSLICEAKIRVKVFERGNRNKWPQAMVIGSDWSEFVTKTRSRLDLPANNFPVLKFYDAEDFEMQNPQEVDDGQYVFVDTSGQEVAPSLEGGAIAYVPRDHFKKPGTKVHVWNYPAGETAETPPAEAGSPAQAAPAASTGAAGGQRAQIEQQIQALNQKMDQLAASRQYAQAAQVQAQVEQLTATLKSLPAEDANAAKRAQIQAAMSQIESKMSQAAAARKYAEAAQLQQQYEQLQAQLKQL